MGRRALRSLSPLSCVLQEGGFVHRWSNRWFLYHRNSWLSYWKSPRESLPLGVIDWRSVTGVGLSQEVLTNPGDFQIDSERGTSGSRTHFLRAKSSEARDRWIEVLLDGQPLPAGTSAAAPVPQNEATAIALEPRDKEAWKPIFSVPLEQLLEIEERVGQVPLLVAAMVEHMAPLAGAVSKDLFTTPGAASAVLSVKSALEQGLNPSSILEDAGDVHVAATCLRKFLMDLPEPVCTTVAYQDFLDSCVADDPAAEMRLVVDALPPAHERLLRELVGFMKHLLDSEEDNGLSVQILAESLGNCMLRPHCVYSGESPAATAASTAIGVMITESDRVFQDPPLLKAPVFKNATFKLLLTGRMLRVSPDDVQRKIAALEEIEQLRAKLQRIEGDSADQKYTDMVTKALNDVTASFYKMEVPCGAANVDLDADKVAPRLLREIADHIDLLQKEEVHMRAALRRCDSSNRPMFDAYSLPTVLKEVGAAIGIGDNFLDAEDMFLELWYLRGEQPRPFTLPELLDVLGKWMELKGLFRQADKYKAGFIMVEDVVGAMREFGALWGYAPSPFHVLHLLHEFDVDARHGITWEEFRMLMHRWIEERKQGKQVGTAAGSEVESLRSEDVLVSEYKEELRCLYTKFEHTQGGLEILCLGGLFEEICHAFELGQTLSDAFRLMRLVESQGVVQWDGFVGVMSKWIIARQLFVNFSKDGGKHIHADDLAYALQDLKAIWGCFDPREGVDDVAVLAKELAAGVVMPRLTFEEFINGLRHQLALKCIFELHAQGEGTLDVEAALRALKAVEEYCGQPTACSETLGSLAGLANLDGNIAMTWADFLLIANISVGDEYDGSS